MSLSINKVSGLTEKAKDWLAKNSFKQVFTVNSPDGAFYEDIPYNIWVHSSTQTALIEAPQIITWNLGPIFKMGLKAIHGFGDRNCGKWIAESLWPFEEFQTIEEDMIIEAEKHI